MALSYKGYRVGSIEKNILQLLLNIKEAELPKRGYGPTFSDILSTARQKREFSSVIHRLKQKNLISFRDEHGTVTASLTEKGRRVAEIITSERGKNVRRPEKWDRVWRVVIFDIPQKRQIARDMLRNQLKKFGFRQVQASVWAYPFPCEDIIALVKTYFELGDEVLYLNVTSLEGDAKLRRFFHI